MTEVAARDLTCSSCSGGTPSNSRVPAPSVSGTMCSRNSSIRPAARYWLMVVAPPWTQTSPSPAASGARQCGFDSAGGEVVRDAAVHRLRVARVVGEHETGAWNGGSSPRQPFHCRSHSPRTGPNMLRPMMNALAAVIWPTSSGFSSGVSNIQACSRASCRWRRRSRRGWKRRRMCR